MKRLRGQDYPIGTARKMSVDIDATPDLLLLIQQKLRIAQYRYGSLSSSWYTLAFSGKSSPCFCSETRTHIRQVQTYQYRKSFTILPISVVHSATSNHHIIQDINSTVVDTQIIERQSEKSCNNNDFQQLLTTFSSTSETKTFGT